MSHYSVTYQEARRRMKVWTGGIDDITLLAERYKITRKELEEWCRTAMRGAKSELAKSMASQKSPNQ